MKTEPEPGGGIELPGQLRVSRPCLLQCLTDCSGGLGAAGRGADPLQQSSQPVDFHLLLFNDGLAFAPQLPPENFELGLALAQTDIHDLASGDNVA